MLATDDELRAENAVGTDQDARTGSATLTLTVNNPPPPVISSATTASGTAGVAFIYQIAASNNPTGYGATSLPDGLSVNTTTGAITGTPTTPGTADVTIAATNPGGTGSCTLTITIAPADPPIITSALTASVAQGQAFSYQITASGTMPMTFGASSLPDGLSLSESTIAGTPSQAGAFCVYLSAGNYGGTDTKALIITVGCSSGSNTTQPAFASPPATPPPAVAGQSVTLTASGSDAGGDALLYTWDFGDGTTGYGASISHTYTAPGVYNAKVTISDGVNSASQTVDVAVNEAAPDLSGGSGDLPNVFDVLKASIRFNLKEKDAGKDSLVLAGTLPLEKNFNPVEKEVTVAICGLEQSFKLSKKGKSGSSACSFKLAGKMKKGIFTGTPARFSLAMKKQSLFTCLEELGFTDADVLKPGDQVEVPVIISVDGVSFLDPVTVTYTATAGKSGSARR
ncbi:MAG: PKD domain-containing protein [Planctomycetota bacterium]|nr:PKD domain-containing protein [Planctomycetota bacterium]